MIIILIMIKLSSRNSAKLSIDRFSEPVIGACLILNVEFQVESGNTYGRQTLNNYK